MKSKIPINIRVSSTVAPVYKRFAERLRHIAKKKGHAPPTARDIATCAFEIAYDTITGKVHKEWKERAQADFEAAGEAWMKMREAQLHNEYMQKFLGLISEAFSEVLGPGVVAARINADGVVEIRYLGQDETVDLAHAAAWMTAARAAGEGDKGRLQ